MIKKFRRKIIILLSAIYAVATVIILCIVFIMLRKNSFVNTSQMLAAYITLNESSKNMSTSYIGASNTGLENYISGDYTVNTDDSGNVLGNSNGEDMDVLNEPIGENGISIMNSYAIYLVKIENEEAVFVSASGGGSLTEAESEDIGNEIFSLSKISGIYGNYQFESGSVNDTVCIAFTDISDIFLMQKYILLKFIIVGIAVIIIFNILSVYISKILVKPLEIAMDKQSDFILMAGHELKTPISVLKTSLYMLKKEGVKSKYLNYAESENEKMNGLVMEMLDLSKLESEKDMPENKEFDLSACINREALLFEAMAFEKKINYNINVEDNLKIKGDENKISRMLGIFIDNAIKHTNEGGMALVNLKKENGKIKLAVSNEGEKIDESDMEKIFEKFYRVDKARSRQDGRFGLGLSIASAIATQHGTKINVNSDEHLTTFYVYLS